MSTLKRLPGIGAKSASRLALHILRGSPQLADELISALTEISHTVRRCDSCRTFTTQKTCELCRDPRRQTDILCVVEGVSDMWAIEQSSAYRGRYHILHGSLAPLDGVGPDQLEVESLMERVAREAPAEVILATGTDVNGETTALYLAQELAHLPVNITRLASGLPSGGGLEYADSATLELALTHRRDMTRFA